MAIGGAAEAGVGWRPLAAAVYSTRSGMSSAAEGYRSGMLAGGVDSLPPSWGIVWFARPGEVALL